VTLFHPISRQVQARVESRLLPYSVTGFTSSTNSCLYSHLLHE
jgi:hypothetical protein